MSENYRKSDIYVTTQMIINAIEEMGKTGADKALLASLRHSIGKPLSQSPDIWPVLFRYMPEKYLSKSGQETTGEKAVCTALQMYALYRQGNTTHSSGDNINFGGSVNRIRNTGDDVLDKRMNMILTSEDFEELSYRLRQMVKLCKSRDNLSINFAELANDLYCWMNGNKDRIRLAWAQSYYRLQKNDSETEESSEKNKEEE